VVYFSAFALGKRIHYTISRGLSAPPERIVEVLLARFEKAGGLRLGYERAPGPRRGCCQLLNWSVYLSHDRFLPVAYLYAVRIRPLKQLPRGLFRLVLGLVPTKAPLGIAARRRCLSLVVAGTDGVWHLSS
jgi:hypothetical protein